MKVTTNFYWFNPVGDVWYFLTRDNTEQFPVPPEPKVEVETYRDGPKSGSGPYYKRVRRPYYDTLSAKWGSKTGLVRIQDEIEVLSSTDSYRYRAHCWDVEPRIVSSGPSRSVQTLSVGVNKRTGRPNSIVLHCVVCHSTNDWVLSTTLSVQDIYTNILDDAELLSKDELWDKLESLFVTALGLTIRQLTHSQRVSRSATYTDSDGKTCKLIATSGAWTNMTAMQTLVVDEVKWMYDDIPNYYHLWSALNFGIIPGEIRNEVALAYQKSAASLPEVSANSIANVFEIASALTNVASAISRGTEAIARLAVNTAKSIRDPKQDWLRWRYVYNTTKLDLQEYKDVTNRLIALGEQSGTTFKTSGTAYTADGARIKCTETWSTSDYDLVDMDTRRLLETYGFKLSAYNAWDMIPFSFMVDWFIPVGDTLEHMEAWAKRRTLESQDHWFSFSKTFKHSYVYFRWRGSLPTLEPTYTRRTVSGKTLTFRVADTISIFT